MKGSIRKRLTILSTTSLLLMFALVMTPVVECTNKSELYSDVSVALTKFVMEPLPRDSMLDLLPDEIIELMPAVKSYFSPNPKRFSLKEIESYVACTACTAGVDTMLFLYDQFDLDENFLVERMSELCALFVGMDEDECKSILDSFLATVVRLIELEEVNGAETCTLIIGGKCGEDHPLHDWHVDIPGYNENNNVKNEKETNETSSSFQLLHLTDLHLDLEYDLESARNCGNSVLCCTNGSRKAESWEAKVGYYGQSDCDLPEWTLTETLKHIKETQNVDFLLLAGDFPAHDLWKQSRESNLKRTSKVVELIQRELPNVTVLPALGNHESFPSNLFPPRSVSDPEFEISWLYDALAELYSPWLDSDAINSFRQNGYYSQLAPGGQVRIVTINTNFCYHLNLWLMLEHEDLGMQLKWLVQELVSAEKRGEKVIINGHVPTGSSSCFGGWGREFARIIARFEKTVVAQFYGHTHRNSFYIFYDTETRPINVGHVTPSVTPWENLNPAYSIFTFDQNQLVRRETFSFDLELANAAGPDERPEWRRICDESQLFNMTEMRPSDYHQLVQRLAEDENLFEQYKEIYVSLGNTKEERAEILCNLVTTDSSDLSRCDQFQDGSRNGH